MKQRAWGGAYRFIVAAFAAAILFAPAASASEILVLPRLPPVPIENRADFFGGVDVAENAYSTWLGFSYAPAGRLDQDGWRIRVAGGRGGYRYRNGNLPGGENRAQVYSGELLGGYRRTFGPLITSVYFGVEVEEQLLLQPDAANPTAGFASGFKGAVELYARLWQRYIVTGFVNGSTTHGKYNARASLSRELSERWALGFEGGALGDKRSSELRAGLIGTLTWRRRIVALSLGALDNSYTGTGGYATLSLYAPF